MPLGFLRPVSSVSTCSLRMVICSCVVTAQAVQLHTATSALDSALCSIHQLACRMNLWPSLSRHSRQSLLPSVRNLAVLRLGLLVGAVAGSNCEDFSRLGNRQGLAGPTMSTFHCFTANVKALQPDFMLCENADTCPHELLSDAFGDQYDFMTGVAAPTDFGWPCLRPRRYTFAWKKSDFIFPASFEDYKNMFQRPVSGDGSVFLQASKGALCFHGCKGIQAWQLVWPGLRGPNFCRLDSRGVQAVRSIPRTCGQ